MFLSPSLIPQILGISGLVVVVVSPSLSHCILDLCAHIVSSET